MSCLLDTHFLIWILTKSKRLKEFAWLDEYRPWGLSPVSILELQFLWEAGKLHIHDVSFITALLADRRFIVDDVSIMTLTQKAMNVSWTRDPFDRLLAAHSLARRAPLCSVDIAVLDNHKLLVPELA
jgi:PIN domain nuclease of toxin-antitoxin system